MTLSRFLPKIGLDRDVFMNLKGKSVSLLTVGFYSMEWVLYFAIFIFAQMFRRLVHPRFSDFSLMDSQISHVTYNQRQLLFPRLFILLTTGGLTTLTAGALNAFSPTYTMSRRWWNSHSSFLTILGTNAMQSVIVAILKNVTGKPRPDLVSRCQPSLQNVGQLQFNIDISSCTTTDLRALSDGFRSFPSGTSATAFSNLALLTFFILSRLNIYQYPTTSNSLSLSVVGFPLVLASVISLSTLADNRHFLSDSIFGALVGIGSAMLVYRQYFPAIWRSPQSLVMPNGKVAEEDLSLAYEPKRFFSDQSAKWKVDPIESKSEEAVSGTISANNLTRRSFPTRSQVTV
ncbi:probable diacylglycerol pyrophosphate phosphatase 1 [Kluyveromyces marxianus DMKU3-1042]|uniref:Probable diacylglycerol pyrophosphate phosphatase 1 n=1 Tax=Kluyveromyces marxianus (strain DMKU3-1042 / BCC 29191 / NBRC 104275) TaxID=1003335 RepID=W0TDU2_KLUMD|nr:probable diacylglycerol pyrophosphate phosphatase 1 [Kluyveromyces marxianus DMKU3-1042]BAO41243.1 probable diacylglycerol pyrophosphate phosphatase 1 [Kluyveromyces marxianus DMKU3-1042]